MKKKINSQNILGIVDNITSPKRKISFNINRGSYIRSYVVKDEDGGRYSIYVTDYFGVNNNETETYVYFFDSRFAHHFEGLFSRTTPPVEFIKEFDNYFWKGNVGVRHYYGTSSI